MKQFLTVLLFEFMGYLKNSVYRSITLVFMLIIVFAFCYPRLKLLQEGNENKGKVVAVSIQTSAQTPEELVDALHQKMPQYDFRTMDATPEELKAGEEAGEYQFALHLIDPTQYTYIVRSMGLNDVNTRMINEVLSDQYRVKMFEGFGFSKDRAKEMSTPKINVSITEIKKQSTDGFFYTYFMLIFLFVAIVFYCQFVATSVASEKNSKTMEVLLTSAKPTNLIYGKVIGSGLAGLLQMLLLLITAMIAFRTNSHLWMDTKVLSSFFDTSISNFIFAIIFFLLGYFMYAFLTGALASFAAQTSDVQMLTTPVILLFTAGYLIVVMSTISGAVNDPLMVICSFIPFFSPIAMFARITLGEVQGIEILISILILLVSIFLLGYLSAFIYKAGAFNNKPLRFGLRLKK